MSSYGEDIIRETFEKFGDAIGVQMQIPDAMIANLGAVLQAQIDLLAELQSTGRLIPAGGMALTAEQVEDVRTAREELRGYRNFTGYGRSHVNQLIAAVDALFPATEPAEEETKAERCPSEIEGWGCSLTSGHDGDHTAHDQDGPAYVWPASSPVVPAPTETGPWQTWQEVPEGVKYSPKARPPAGSPLRLLAQPLWVNRGGTRYQARSGTVSKIGDVEMFHYAPFVAAEEKDA